MDILSYLEEEQHSCPIQQSKLRVKAYDLHVHVLLVLVLIKFMQTMFKITLQPDNEQVVSKMQEKCVSLILIQM